MSRAKLAADGWTGAIAYVGFHRPDRCRKVREYLQPWRHRVQLHFLPAYAPETNPIERLWWHLQGEITRNHRCHDIEELLNLVFDWLNAGLSFEIETSIYEPAKAASPLSPGCGAI